MKRTQIILFFISFLSSCSQLQQSEEERVRRNNLKADLIQRTSEESLAQLPPPRLQPRDPYPWEKLEQPRSNR